MPTYRKRNGRVQVQVRIKSNGVIVHQESATFDTQAQAKLWGESLEKRIQKDGVGARKAGQVTLGDLMDMHIAMLKKSSRQFKAIEGRFKSFRSYKIVDKSVDALAASDFIEWGVEHSKGRSPATILNHMMAIRAAYRAAPVAHNIPLDISVVGNAIDHLRRLRVVAASEERDRRVSDEEIQRMEDWWIKLDNTLIPLPIILRFLVALPRRREEVMKLEWSDYDEKNQTLTLRDTKHPTKPRTEVIPVPPAAQAILASLPRADARILPYIGKSVSGAFQRTAQMLGIEDITLHDLRHEGISRLFEMGLNIPEVALISGHKNWQTLKRYTHIKPKQVLDKLART
ncbi:MAG: site-specific integrase [Burkholderiaceae bacterium]|jgi:integrase|nr:site-specific integrase [Burkholderiaceae bacterium]